MTTVSIIGPGRLGMSLGRALERAGYQVEAFIARTGNKPRRFNSKAKCLTIDELEELPGDVVFITTPDDAISAVAKRLAGLKQLRKRPVVLHTSGALSSEVLMSLSKKGYPTGSFHPLVSVDSASSDPKIFRGVYFAIEGTGRAQRMGTKIARDLGGRSFTVDSANKALYHAAALTAAGHVTSLIDLSIEMLIVCGQDEDTARQILAPLLRSTIDNLEHARPQEALTGTYARGDLATVKKHLAALSAKNTRKHAPDALTIYKLLGLHSLRLAEKNGLDRKRARQIRKLLS